MICNQYIANMSKLRGRQILVKRALVYKSYYIRFFARLLFEPLIFLSLNIHLA
jgi:hypothetical protein